MDDLIAGGLWIILALFLAFLINLATYVREDIALFESRGYRRDRIILVYYLIKIIVAASLSMLAYFFALFLSALCMASNRALGVTVFLFIAPFIAFGASVYWYSSFGYIWVRKWVLTSITKKEK